MTKICKIEVCQGTLSIRRGWCNKHYLRWLRYGDVNRGRIPPSPETLKRRSESLKKHYAEHPERASRHSEFMKSIRHAGNFKKGVPSWNKGKELPKRSGENHHNWKGGTTRPSKLERVKFQQSIQQLVFQRDDYTCQICDQHGGYLQVDHIKSWAKHPELRLELDNCRTLCMACHYYLTFKNKIPHGITWGHNLKWGIKP